MMKFKRIRYGLIVLVLIVLGLLAYKYFSNSTERKAAKLGTSTPGQFENNTQKSADNFLTKKDYQSYISNQVSVASHYEAIKDNASAERVMKEVFDNVPADKVNTMAYSEMANIEQALGKTEEYKHYLTLLAKQYQAEGNTQAAASIQGLADSIK